MDSQPIRDSVLYYNQSQVIIDCVSRLQSFYSDPISYKLDSLQIYPLDMI